MGSHLVASLRRVVWGVAAHHRAAGAWLALGTLVPFGSSQCFTSQLSSPSQSSGDYFGQALAADGPWLVVGGRFAATIYRRDGEGTPLDATDDTWWLNSHFLSEDPFLDDAFGSAVTIEGDHMIVGALAWPTSFPGGGPGAIYIYRRVEGSSPGPMDDSWVQEMLVTGNIPGASGGLFGTAVSLQRDRAAVGAPGAKLDSQVLGNGLVHIFRHDDGGTPLDQADDTWIHETALAANTAATSERFGAAVDFDGENLLVGSPKFFFNGPGSAYHFRLDDSGTPDDFTDDTWIEHAKLTPPPGTAGTLFGEVLDLDGTRALIGSDGAAFLFELDDAGTPTDPADDFWVDAGMLAADEAGAPEDYGLAVSLAGERALVGAPLQFAGLSYCVAHVFAKSNPVGAQLRGVPRWTEIAKLTAPVPPAVNVGCAVVLHGDQAIVGERGDFPFLTGDGESVSYGSALVFAMAVAPWSYIDAPQAGVLNPPCLLGAGPLLPDGDAVVTVDHAEANANTALVVGFAALLLPFKDGILFPTPDFIVWLATDAAGSLTVTMRWPAGVPEGFEFFAQAWVADQAAPGGYAATSALHAEVPP